MMWSGAPPSNVSEVLLSRTSRGRLLLAIQIASILVDGQLPCTTGVPCKQGSHAGRGPMQAGGPMQGGPCCGTTQDPQVITCRVGLSCGCSLKDRQMPSRLMSCCLCSCHLAPNLGNALLHRQLHAHAFVAALWHCLGLLACCLGRTEG